MALYDPIPEIPKEEGASLDRMLAIVVVAVVACSVGVSIYLFLEVRSAQAEIASHSEQLQKYEEQFSQLAATEGRVNETLQKSARDFAGRVTRAEKQILESAEKNQQRFLGRTQRLAKEIQQQGTEQKTAITTVDQKVEKLSTEAEKTQARVGSLVNTVDDVRSEVEKNREELQKTIGELTSVKGDLGVKSGLIATNAAELEALQELGQRNYHAFDITKSRHSQRVGSIDIRLKKASHKRNHYTMELLVDDKKVEKKNKTLLEPVQFYVAGARIPHEIVVNKIEKNRIVGYLSSPKVQKRRGAMAQSGSN